MKDRASRMYVNGTSALEIPCGQKGAGGRLIRVDFKNTGVHAVDAEERSAAKNGFHFIRSVSSAYAKRPNATSRANEDIAVAVKALGFDEIRDELARGSVAGSAVREVPLKIMVSCCLALLVFGLVLVRL